MKTILKNIIIYGLSLLIVATTFHIDYHVDEHQDGYNICDISCNDERHHSINHQCQKCLNKNQRLYFLTGHNLLINQRTVNYYIIRKINYDNSIIFDLHSRPPPSLT